MSYPRHQRSRVMKKARRTAGNLTINGTSWANVDTGLDLVLNEVQVGDELIFGLSAMWGNEAIHGHMDVVTVVSGSPVNSFAKRGAVEASPGYKVAGWYGIASAYTMIGCTTPPYTVVSGDLSAGTVTLRLRAATLTAGNKTLRANTQEPLDVWAWVDGPGQA